MYAGAHTVHLSILSSLSSSISSILFCAVLFYLHSRLYIYIIESNLILSDLSVYLFDLSYLSIFLILSIYLILSIHLSIHPSIHPSIYLSIINSIPFHSIPFYSIYLSNLPLSLYLSIYLSV